MIVNDGTLANTNYLLPIQPELMNNVFDYVEKLYEWNPVTRNSAIFYQFTTKNVISRKINIVPDGCIDIVFCCSKHSPSAIFYGNRLSQSQIILKPNCTYFGFKPLSNYGVKQYKYSVQELVDQHVSLIEIIPETNILDKLIQSSSINDRIALFSDYVRHYLINYDFIDPLSQYCFDRICNMRGDLRIDKLAKDIGYSDRYLRHKYTQSFGISPKQFSQIVRFQNALNMLVKTSTHDLDIVFDNGFYDHAHLIKAFKKQISQTPKMFKQKLNLSLI